MSRPPRFPLVPQVQFPWDFETDDHLYEAKHAAIGTGDPRAHAEAELNLAHRAMVKRDAALADLVRGVQQQRDGEDVAAGASRYAFWHALMEQRTQEAAGFVKQAGVRVTDAEAER